MKIKALWALLLQVLLITSVYATTYSVKVSQKQPQNLPVLQGALMHMLSVDVLVEDKQFPPDFYLAVQQYGPTKWNQNPVVGIWVGDEFKSISEGPFVNENAPTIIGPIRLRQGVVKTVTISAQFRDDLTDVDGKVIGLKVVGAAVDGYLTDVDDTISFAASFPLIGEYRSIDASRTVGKAIIRNTTDFSVSQIGEEPTIIGEFEVNVQNKEIELPYIHVGLRSSRGGNVADIKSVTVYDNGRIIAGPIDIRSSDDTSYGDFVADGAIILSEGVHKLTFVGTIGNTVPDDTTISLMWPFSGTFTDKDGYKSFPEISNENLGVVVRSKTARFNFKQNLLLGAISYDVLILQRVLGVEPESRPISEGPPSQNYFGPLTQAAVRKFQSERGIPPTGFVGPLTRASLNALDLESFVWLERVAITRSSLGSGYANMMITGRPGVDYSFQESRDLKTWSTLRSIRTDESGRYGYKVDMMENDGTFFRLVRKN